MARLKNTFRKDYVSCILKYYFIYWFSCLYDYFSKHSYFMSLFIPKSILHLQMQKGQENRTKVLQFNNECYFIVHVNAAFLKIWCITLVFPYIQWVIKCYGAGGLSFDDITEKVPGTHRRSCFLQIFVCPSIKKC